MFVSRTAERPQFSVHSRRLLAVEAAAVALLLGTALIVVFAVWEFVGPSTYQGGDGKGFQSLTINTLRFARPFEVNVLNPLQGMFNQQLPVNVWLNPVYLVFHLVEGQAGLNISTAIAYAALALATYMLGRACGLGAPISIMGGLSVVVMFPPFLFLFGLNTQYMLAPASAYTLAILTVLLALVRRPPGGILVSAVAYAAILFYAVYCDPVFVLAGLLGLAPAFAVLSSAGGRRRAMGTLAALFLAAVLLYLLGTVDYLLAFVRYTARSEFFAVQDRPADTGLASVLFISPTRAGRFYLGLGAGWILGASFAGPGCRRLFAACLVLALSLATLVAAYLFGGFAWPGPVPLYLEQSALHVLILGGIAGWAVAAGRLVRAISGLFARLGDLRQVHGDQNEARVRRAANSIGGAVVAALPVLALAYFYAEASPGLKNHYNEPWPEQVPAIAELRARIGLAEDSQFRGSVAVMKGGYNSILMIADLWRKGIPTLNEYSQLVTPPFLYLATHLLASFDRPVSINGIQIAIPRTDLLAAMGARFLIVPWAGQTTVPSALLPDKTFDQTLAGQRATWAQVSLPHPNTGDYSPTQVLRADDAPAILAQLRRQGFDYRRDIVLSSQAEVPVLAPAEAGELRFERGRIRVTARSPGDSLLLLPVQFSHCLTIRGDGPAKLVRANLIFAALLFTRSVDVEIEYGFGILQSACRKLDIADSRRMEVGFGPASAELRRENFPLAIRTPADFPRVLSKLGNRVAAAAQTPTLAILAGPMTAKIDRVRCAWLNSTDPVCANRKN